MTGASIVTGMQLLAAALWATVVLVRAPAVVRVIRQAPVSVIDFYSVILAGMGAMQAGFALRWWLYPQTKTDMQPGELALWGSLYAVSTMIALATHAVPRRA